ncbi:MAG: DedA family protein [Candidatus Binatia bacterium]
MDLSMLSFALSDPGQFLEYWGYPAIFVFVFLGNLGLPVPEETVLLVAGYLVWKGKLLFEVTAVVGVVSAVTGDNFGYWVGRHYGARALMRYGRWLFVTPERSYKMQRFVSRYGVAGIFVARFLPGFRFMAGPLAGTTSMPFRRFFLANLCGAVIYVPLMVTAGYGVGFGLAELLGEYERRFGGFDRIILLTIALSVWAILARRILRSSLRALDPKE